MKDQQELLRRCNTTEILTFEDIFEGKTLRILGKGSFAVIFAEYDNEQIVAVYKVIAYDYFEAQGPHNCSYENALLDLKTSKALDTLKDGTSNKTTNFVNLLGAWAVSDSLMNVNFVGEDIYCIRNNPGRMKTKDYLVQKLEYGGQELETMEDLRPQQTYSLIAQIALAMEAAEKEFSFINDDLCLQNILIKETDEDVLSFTINNEEVAVKTHGVKAVLIDFSYSHITLNNQVHCFKSPGSNANQKSTPPRLRDFSTLTFHNNRVRLFRVASRMMVMFIAPNEEEWRIGVKYNWLLIMQGCKSFLQEVYKLHLRRLVGPS